jgi:hypothetical protein
LDSQKYIWADYLMFHRNSAAFALWSPSKYTVSIKNTETHVPHPTEFTRNLPKYPTIKTQFNQTKKSFQVFLFYFNFNQFSIIKINWQYLKKVLLYWRGSGSHFSCYGRISLDMSIIIKSWQQRTKNEFIDPPFFV